MDNIWDEEMMLRRCLPVIGTVAQADKNRQEKATVSE
jgi:hypothetical protein